MNEFIEAFRRLAIPYWKSEDKWRAYGLLAAIVAFNLGMVYFLVRINLWYRDFYNVLQTLNKAAFLPTILRFCLLAAAYIFLAVYMLYLSQMLQIRWRNWLTDKYLTEWLNHKAYYRINFDGAATDNPDQRISEDINSYIEQTISLGTSLLNSVASLFSFLGILWVLSGSLPIPLGAHSFALPGYMVWASLVYAIFGTWVTIRVGNPLVRLNFDQQRYEADFRFSMVRVREHSESIALYGGEGQEQTHLMGRFTSLLENFWKIMKRQKRLSWVTYSYSQAAVIFPLLMAAPRFFSHQMQLGGLMQTVDAFGQVQNSLSFLVTSYAIIASWHAVINRLMGFSRTMDRLETTELLPGTKCACACDKAIRIEAFNVALPDGKLLVRDLQLDIEAGAHLLITGPSGCGKSTLIRALAGIWPFCEGTTFMPESSKVMFLPQKPYLPLGTLSNALCYPNANGYRREDFETVLEQCGLAHLIDELDKDKDWAHVLSLGEQQRLAFSRILLVKPDFVFLDEATASVDEKLEADLYRQLQESMPCSAVISVGHRGTLVAWHTQTLTFDEDANWVKSSLSAQSRGANA
ncbi:MAG: ABC transporter ATP-binding protein/permease [Syntrophobacteraceae bacterium]|nr:ABC transporter ATP-binding protein/permease [Syntrophobacteraceae bacterium]